jgi:ribonuclease Z
MGRWQEGLMFGGISPTPGLMSAANSFPRTEEVGPDELRITFMGSAPFIRPGQMNTSIFIELGNGDNFVFDIGEGFPAGLEPAPAFASRLARLCLSGVSSAL